MNSKTTQNETAFTLRVPDALNEKLVAQAKAEKRSRHAHIVYLLNKHFETENSIGDKKGKRK